MSCSIRRVCTYCGASRQTGDDYTECARRLGTLLVQNGITLVYGGASTGTMGSIADAALAAGGRVIGILPRFMQDLEWAHTGLTELRLVDDLRERKRLMLEDVDAVIALPGGTGTLEELMETVTLKRLGLYTGPIVIVNVRGYFDPLVAFFDKAIRERFMAPQHRRMWSVVTSPEDALSAIRNAPTWDPNARG